MNKKKLAKIQDATDNALKEIFIESNLKRSELKRQENQIREAFMSIGSYLFVFGVLILFVGSIMICLQLLYWILSAFGIPVFTFAAGLIMLCYGLVVYLVGDE